ncbi:cytoplasmic 60S subunit biogenesis factor ZNF622 [Condylostylus longicornis]|uniref:cytoplasmic 60S subunit biogenesis factor ZNF622 n=1 Tax=Condylostylus longicornis TaxID=2530218 RepID=UPI00244DD30C|nr:cytoplasmic 60S subunit biogenesis factor ZNF622 [Condylostylus longicornis]
MSTFTCISCGVKFENSEIQRDHYKTDWHRYNLKRRVASLPPVTAQEFQNRVVNQRNVDLEENTRTSLFCSACRKNFSSEKSHETHLNSKKHKDNIELFKKEDLEQVTIKNIVLPKTEPISKRVESCMEDEELDSDSWEDIMEKPITTNDCIFCENESENMTSNLEHMSVSHSFFIPDIEYCVNLEGLLLLLAEKVIKDYICLWCNDKGKTFYSLDAVRKHMKDKGHCKMWHEGIALAEYSDFYDYSSTYPDNVEGMDIDEEFEPELLEGDEYQLVLPSGAVIGHRSLLRYYKQRLNPNRAVTIHKNDKKLHKVLLQYRALGWTKTEQELAAKKARDIHMMKRIQSKWAMKLGCKNNKLQKHFRAQIN